LVVGSIPTPGAMLIKHKILVIVMLIVLITSNVLLVGFNVYLLFSHQPPKLITKNSYNLKNTYQKIKDIETYLDSISSSYMVDEQALAKQNNLPSWGCGPSSYALAKILNKNFLMTS